ncbi:MAG: hypothetical protein JW388_0956 [Nitrospira sp.]|nr:hypothetical protein [Nitrospira sp.]
MPDCELPEKEALGAYVAIYDEEACAKALDKPTALRKSFLYFNGSEAVWADGDTVPIALNFEEVEKNTSSPNFGTTGSAMLFSGTDGQIYEVRFDEGESAQYVPVFQSGTLKFVELDLAPELPAGDNGIVVKEDDAATLLTGNGIPYIDEDDKAQLLGAGLDGQILAWDDATKAPIWSSSGSGGSVAGGGSGLDGVRGESSNGTTATYSVDMMQLRSAAGDITTIVDFSKTLDFTTNEAPGGTDDAAPAGSRWWYVYALCESGDPTVMDLIASESDTGPNFGAPWNAGTSYDRYGLLGVIYLDAGVQIVPFSQRGRSYQVENVEVGYNLSASEGSWTAADIEGQAPSCVPPNVDSVSGIVGGNNTASGTKENSQNRALALSMNSSGFSYQIPAVCSAGTTLHLSGQFRYWMGQFTNFPVVNPNPTIYMKSLNGSINRIRMTLNGYRIR